MAPKKIDSPAEIRFQPDQLIRLGVLDGSSRSLSARIVNFAGRRAQLRLMEAIRPGEGIRIDLHDCALLGEIAACSPDAEGFLALILIYEAIPSVSDLGRLVGAVLRESPQTTVPEESRPREIMPLEMAQRMEMAQREVARKANTISR